MGLLNFDCQPYLDELIKDGKIHITDSFSSSEKVNIMLTAMQEKNFDIIDVKVTSSRYYEFFFIVYRYNLENDNK